MPHRADGSPDADAWRALARAVQDAIKALPPQRLAHLAKLRETALQPAPSRNIARTIAAAAAVPARPSRPGWLPALLWTGVVACVAGFAITFLWPQARRDVPGGAPEIRTVSLPHAAAPAARFDARTALLSDRDFDLLLDPRDEAVYRDLDFYAWYVAQQSAPAANAPGSPANAPSQHEDGNDDPETTDATL